MKLSSGCIPVDIVYIFGAPIRVTRKWDYVYQAEEELAYRKVTPAFVADADNKKSIESGISWAQNMCVKWNPTTCQIDVVAEVQKVQKKNEPMSGIKVVGLETKDQIGRIYKVLTTDGFYFDLTHDVFLDVILSSGIKPEGEIPGEFQWAIVENEMKLVRVGSDLHTTLLETGTRNILTNIPKNKIEIGSIYETRQGERGIFLGYITTESWRLSWPPGTSLFKAVYLGTSDKPILTTRKLSRHMLWFDVSNFILKNKKEDLTPSLFEQALSNPELSHHFKLKGSVAVVRKVGDVEIPTDIVELVRQKALKSFEKKVHQLSPNQNQDKFAYYNQIKLVALAAATLLMRKTGEPCPTVDNSAFLSVQQYVGKQIPENLSF